MSNRSHATPSEEYHTSLWLTQEGSELTDGEEHPPLIGPISDIMQLAALLAVADGVVANDSGPMHLAAALGVPTVGLFGPTDPFYVGMSVTIMSGLTFGTLLTLVVVPIFYAIFFRVPAPGHDFISASHTSRGSAPRDANAPSTSAKRGWTAFFRRKQHA